MKINPKSLRHLAALLFASSLVIAALLFASGRWDAGLFGLFAAGWNAWSYDQARRYERENK